jgi:cell division protein FtsN
MRIDYSEPKQSYVASQAKARPRKEPVGLIAALVVIAVVIGFVAGFGTGWFFSQRSAKKSFQAAAEQSSLENSSNHSDTAPLPPQVKPQPAAADSASQPQAGSVQAAPGSPTPSEPALSFYKTLPGGQAGNVLGSGINSRDENAKQQLQAAIPSNVIKQQLAVSNAKTATERSAAVDKAVERASDSGYVVQVASYSLRSEADTLKKTLASKGYNVTIVESDLGDKGIWYRVRVGKRLEQDAAKELAGKLGRGAVVIPDRD